MEDRIKELESRVRFYDKLLYAVGAVAFVFGISGGWGLLTINKINASVEQARNRVEAVALEIREVAENSENIDGVFQELLSNAEAQIFATASEIEADLPSMLTNEMVLKF